MMQQTNKIPLHHCQWCYKATGRFIIDCLCIACQSCFQKKNKWVDENSKCFCCQKPTQRKFIDLKVNPQQGGMYFQNLNLSMKKVLKIQEFQSQVSRKYCKHLQKKVLKLETIIKTFIRQYPQYQPFFENMMAQMQKRQTNVYRSKSVNEADSKSSKAIGKMLFHNNTEKNLQKQTPQTSSNGKSGYFKPVNKIKMNKPSQKYSVSSHQFQGYQQKRSNNVHSEFQRQDQSIQQDYFQNSNLQFGLQQKSNFPFILEKNSNLRQFDLSQKSQSYKNKNLKNQSKNEVSPIQIYHASGNNKFSDPTKQVNLNNINMQTALRSIKSEDGRDNFIPFHQQNHMDSRRIKKRNQSDSYTIIQSPKNSRHEKVDPYIFHRKKGAK